MRTTLNDAGLLPGQVNVLFGNPDIYNPPGQPYDVAPWNYFGTEGDNYDSGGLNTDPERFANYPNEVTDWVLVSLRTDPQDGSEALCQRAGLLHHDGHIEFVSETDCCELDMDQEYYIVVEHRNHLIVMSHEAVPILNGGSLTYDFRFQDSYLYDPIPLGTFYRQKEVIPGVFAMYAGNGDQTSSTANDTDINGQDYSKWLNNGLEFRTYNFTDHNMSGDRNSQDAAVWQTNSPRNTSVPRD
jgi:hypothetical protein